VDAEVDSGGKASLFDMHVIRDKSAAHCSFTDHSVRVSGTSLLDTWRVTYMSMETVDGQVQPILIRGYAVRPTLVDKPMPGLVLSHGLGGRADLDHAANLAQMTGMFVLSYSGPGSGDTPETLSGGMAPTSNNWYRLFDTKTDVRGTWFWGHAVAAMRGLVCLEERSDVDANRLGMTGYSAGAVTTLIVAGADGRVKAAAPVSGTHAWGVAALSPGAWWHDLLEQAGLSVESPEWTILQAEFIEPAAAAAHVSAATLMINGSADEFFPLTAHAATFDAIPHQNKRTSIIGNYDHGCFVHSSVEPAAAVQSRASLRIDGGQAMWFRHWLGGDPNHAHVPAAPNLDTQQLSDSVLVTATIDPGGAKLKVEQVAYWFSVDDAYSWGGLALDSAGGNSFAGSLPLQLPPNTISYVDVQYSTKALVNPAKFSISSVPRGPSGFVPRIRDMDTCQ
jgi:cephalosporin-C deacetylase-like acetyl esterase